MSVVARAVPSEVADELLEGLRREPKRLPHRLVHEHAGAELFEAATGVDDYYPMRCELRLLDAHLPGIASELGVAARVIEPGGGWRIRTKRLLRALDHPASYVAIDSAADSLAAIARALAAEHPNLEVDTVVCDFTRSFTLPLPRRPYRKTLVFVPGMTIGGFEPHDAAAFLGGLQRAAGPNARLLVGADGTHDREALLHAYDDEDGAIATFNTHVLAHLNRTRIATFSLETFSHRAVWNAEQSRIELQLVSLIGQEVTVGGQRFAFAANEPLVTEHMYKHSLHAMRALLLAGGWSPRHVFTAHEQPMRLWLCEPRSA